jgi:hypothetical protein
MQKLINAMAVMSFVFTTGIVVVGAVVYQNRDNIKEDIQEQIIESVSEIIPELIGNSLPGGDLPIPSSSGSSPLPLPIPGF